MQVWGRCGGGSGRDFTESRLKTCFASFCALGDRIFCPRRGGRRKHPNGEKVTKFTWAFSRSERCCSRGGDRFRHSLHREPPKILPCKIFHQGERLPTPLYCVVVDLVNFYADLLADFYPVFLTRIGDFFDFVEEFYAVFLKEEDDC